MADITLRKPGVQDAPEIQKLLAHYAARQMLLPLTTGQVVERLRDFVVAEEEGRLVGCGALHLWSDLAEIRSLAVAESHWRRGVGSTLVRACLQEGRDLGIRRVFVLTYKPEFFERLGFRRVPKETFPHKIWEDCMNCPQFPNCSETALLTELLPVA